MALEQAQKLLGVFKGQVEAGDAGAAGSLLEIKKCMMHFAALPPACGASDKARDELLTARELLSLLMFQNVTRVRVWKLVCSAVAMAATSN